MSRSRSTVAASVALVLALAAGAWIRGAGFPRAPRDARAGSDVEVRVVGPEGEPVAGAEVRLVAIVTSGGRRSAECHRVRADARGIARIAGATACAFELRVEASGYAWFRRDAVRAADSPIVACLERPCSIAGRVCTARGEPVVKWGVWAERLGSPNVVFPARVGADGRFEVGGLPSGDYVVACRRASVSVRVPPDAASALLVVPSGEIRGRLLDASIGREIRWKPSEEWDGEGYVAVERVHDRRRRDVPAEPSSVPGAFAFVDLEPGEYRVLAWVQGFRFLRTDPIALGPAEAVGDLALALERAPVARGIVLDARTDRPVESAVVTFAGNVSHRVEPWQCAVFNPESGLFSATRTTGADGRFEMALPAPGFWPFQVRADGYLPEASALLAGEAGDPPERAVRLRPASSVSGRVTRGGKPVAGAEVRDVRGRSKAAADSEGAFVLRDVAPGPAILSASRSGEPPAFREIVVPEAGHASLDFDLSAGRGGVRGRVRRGEAFEADASVTAYVVAPATIAGRISSERFAGRCATDGTGEYELLGLSAGRYRLFASTSESIGDRAALVDVREGELVSCDLDAPDERLDLRVVDAEGRRARSPVSLTLRFVEPRFDDEAIRTIWDEPYVRHLVVEDAVRLDGVAPGRYELSAESASSGSFTGEITVPCAPVEVRLGRMATVEVRVILPSRPIATAEALLVPHAPGDPMATVRRSGSVLPGRYDVWVGSPSLAPRLFGAVDLAAGETRWIEAAHPIGGARLTLEVAGPLPADAVVSVREAGGADLAPIAGVFPRFRLAAGTYAVGIALPDGRLVEERVTLEDGDDRTLRLMLE